MMYVNHYRADTGFFLFAGFLFLGLLAGCVEGEDGAADGDTGLGTGAPETTGVCTNLSQPCEAVRSNTAGTVIGCRLSTTTCGVDLTEVISQVQFDVTEDSVMWIQAWGASGGSSDKGCDGGEGGYAQTTTSVSDIRSMSSDGSTQMFYFLAGEGSGGDDHCGSAGGSATIVTLADLTGRRSQGPSLASPPTLLVAGGGGGGSGSNNGDVICVSNCMSNAGSGGVAISGQGKNGEGRGGSPESTGGMGGGRGAGGVSFCDICGLCNVCKSGNETDGRPLFGGRGGSGGSGQKCSGPDAPHWTNTDSVTLEMISGSGGKGSSNTKTCDAGGGGGGGGWGGGGGGGHGDDAGRSVSGGGGGSFAIFSTQTSSRAPTGRKANPCKNPRHGCVQLQFGP
ncbi:MAG: hypothetical protein U9R74_03160 [Pseudomonadota bacterium]|nr:hypothetical protein [Pseudomonadota bacterium]